MNPAELKTLRESLGLSSQWLAERAGAQLSTVLYWEEGDDPVPLEVAHMLEHLDDTQNLRAKNIVKAITARRTKPASIVLLRYRSDADLWMFESDLAPLPTRCHAAMLARVRRLLTEKGYSSSIVYMQVAEYNLWLAGRSDSPALREKWALTRIE